MWLELASKEVGGRQGKRSQATGYTRLRGAGKWSAAGVRQAAAVRGPSRNTCTVRTEL